MRKVNKFTAFIERPKVFQLYGDFAFALIVNQRLPLDFAGGFGFLHLVEP